MPELFVKEITSSGVVDVGDNPGATIKFWKRLKSKSKSAASAERKETDVADLDLSALDDETQEAVRKSLADAEARVTAAEEKLAEGPKDPEDVVKSADPEVQAIIKAQNDELAKLRADHEAEVAKHRESDFAKRAQDMEALLGKADDIAPILNKLEKADPEAYAELEPLLKAGAVLADTSEVFKEKGRSGDDGADPVSKQTAFVKARKADGDERSEAELKAQFWSDNPELKSEMREGK